MQAVIWDELRVDLGIDEHDRASWTRPAHSPRRAKTHALNRELIGERFQGAISDLLGRRDWKRPAHWGGFVLVFPDQTGAIYDVPGDPWHWDGAPTADGLLIFSFYSHVRPHGGGTHMLAGSHRLVADFYASL